MKLRFNHVKKITVTVTIYYHFTVWRLWLKHKNYNSTIYIQKWRAYNYKSLAFCFELHLKMRKIYIKPALNHFFHMKCIYMKKPHIHIKSFHHAFSLLIFFRNQTKRFPSYIPLIKCTSHVTYSLITVCKVIYYV